MRIPTPAADRKAAAARECLEAAVQRFGRIVYANSLGAEAVVLVDIVWTAGIEVDVFTIDTGRLHEETRDLIDRIQHHYRRRIRVVHPDAEDLETLARTQGVNGFYGSLERRMNCCGARKVAPFKRAIAGYAAWVTGVRAEQSPTRSQAQPVEWDADYGLYKVSPLLDWRDEEIWDYVRTRGLPYNALHDRQFPSIGCAPCTRAIRPGEHPRAGRWWWEESETRECGLHPRARPKARSA